MTRKQILKQRYVLNYVRQLAPCDGGLKLEKENVQRYSTQYFKELQRNQEILLRKTQ